MKQRKVVGGVRKSYYGGYRGRRSGNKVLLGLVALLAVLVAVLVGFYFLKGQGDAVPPAEVPPVTEEPPAPQPGPEAQVQPDPEPEAVPFVLNAVGVEVSQVLDGSWRTLLEEQSGNALVVNMKPDNGPLGWVSGQPMAADAGANSPLEGINEEIRALNNGDIYTVARLSCFRDELLAGTHAYCIRSNSDYRWKDFGGVHWVNLTVPEVSAYVAALTAELAALGFDEILLDHPGYPRQGSGEMGWIKKGPAYDLNNLDGAVTAFLDQVEGALADYDVKLSIRVDPAALADNGGLTGVTGPVLERYAQRIWMSELDSDLPLAETLSLAGVTGAGERLVTQTREIVPDQDWHQCVLNF